MTHDDTQHAHDLGLSHDLPRMIGRRRVLTLLGALGLGTAAGPALAAQCTALPWETAGPYPADGSNSRDGQVIDVLTQEGVIRTDLRGSFAGMEGEVQGVPLKLDLLLTDADGCTPLAGHAIYVWHCDGEGHYSLYDAPEANWLRGVGVTDDAGKVGFTTIVAGCYDGRWPHIHFEIYENAEAALSGGEPVLTAQIALPEDVAARVYAASDAYPQSTRNLGRISIASDNVFGDNSEAEIAQQTLAMTGDPDKGFTGTVTIPVDFNADRGTQMAPPPGGMPPGGQPPGPPPGKQ